MKNAPIPQNDYLRLNALYDLNILGTIEEEVYTDVVQLAASVCVAPIALITLVDSTKQLVKAKFGIGSNSGYSAGIDREKSICGHAIAQEANFFQVEDTWEDDRFFDNPLVVTYPQVRFYAGMPLLSVKGFKVGMLCVMDTKPNVLAKEQIFALKVLSNYAVMLMDVRIMHTVVQDLFLEKMMGKSGSKAN
jgi:GAF domain-containing protein